MVPHIPAIALSETFAATPQFESASSVGSTAAVAQGSFADAASSPGIQRVEDVEARLNEPGLSLEAEMKRVLSGPKLQPADMLRLRGLININSERIALGKKLSDSLVQGVQTLTKG